MQRWKLPAPARDRPRRGSCSRCGSRSDRPPCRRQGRRRPRSSAGWPPTPPEGRRPRRDEPCSWLSSFTLLSSLASCRPGRPGTSARWPSLGRHRWLADWWAMTAGTESPRRDDRVSLLPAGTVTFLVAEVDQPAAWPRLERVLDAVVAAHGGRLPAGAIAGFEAVAGAMGAAQGLS